MTELRNEEFQVLTLGQVKADGTPDIAQVLFRFPVPHQQMRIRQAVHVDRATIPGRSGKRKQAVGYEDSEIEVQFLLVDEEDRSGAVTRSALEQLQGLQMAFRDRSTPVGDAETSPSTSYDVPTVFSIQSRLTDACGIKTVLFAGLEVTETPGTTELQVTLSLDEFEPSMTLREKRGRRALSSNVSNTSDGTSNQPQSSTGTEADSEAVEAHETAIGSEDPLASAFRDGKRAAMGDWP